MSDTTKILIAIGVLILVIVLVGIISAKPSKQNTNSYTGQIGITGVPKQYLGLPGLGCPNDTDTDSNGNPCPSNCNNGCMEGVVGKDCSGNPSTWC